MSSKIREASAAVALMTTAFTVMDLTGVLSLNAYTVLFLFTLSVVNLTYMVLSVRKHRRR